VSAALLVDRVQKRFGDRALLDLNAITFSAGTLHVIVGDNGVGKTTFLKILSGLEPADQLLLRLDQHKVASSPYPDHLRREIVYVHQHPYLFSTTVDANIGYGLVQRKVEPATREAAVREAIQWAGLDSIAHVRPSKLSGGEKQRVALARAKVLNAPVMLIDEPTANLDGQARVQVAALLESLRLAGRIVIVATHDPALLTLPNVQRWNLEAGQLLFEGAAA